MINTNLKIYVAGHKGLVGSAIVRELKKKGYKKIIVANREKLDLKNQLSVFKFLKKNKPDFIFLAAAKVGGIHSNNKYVPNDASCERIQAMEALVHTSHKPLPCENRLKIHQALWHPERSNPEASLELPDV